jgi:four helix bundle protein
MRAQRYQDLIVWQLADQIRVLILALTERECFARDLKLHSQTEDAVNSMCRNAAEGFGCRHKEFARFLEISRRSLNELHDSLRAAQLKKYITAHDHEPIWRLSHRLYPAYERLITYLRTTPDPDWVINPKRRTNPAKRPSTNPPQGPSTNPRKGAFINPAKHPSTNPPKAPSTDPRKGASTNPAKRPSTNPPQGPSTDPRKGAFTNPAKHPSTNPGEGSFH